MKSDKAKFKKLQKAEKGKYYYRVLCKMTDNELVIDKDPSEGPRHTVEPLDSDPASPFGEKRRPQSQRGLRGVKYFTV